MLTLALLITVCVLDYDTNNTSWHKCLHNRSGGKLILFMSITIFDNQNACLGIIIKMIKPHMGFHSKLHQAWNSILSKNKWHLRYRFYSCRLTYICMQFYFQIVLTFPKIEVEIYREFNISIDRAMLILKTVICWNEFKLTIAAPHHIFKYDRNILFIKFV